MSRNPNDLGLPPAAPDDAAAQYMEHRDNLAQQAAADEMTAAANGAPTTEAPAKPAVEPKPTSTVGARVAKDIAVGATEAPLAAVKGVRDAFGNLFDAGDELAHWLEEKSTGTPFEVMSGAISIGSDGIHWHSPAEARKMRERGEITRTSDLSPLPEQKNPTTVTGGLVKGVAQFVTGMIGASRVIGGTSALARTAQGAASSFTAFDPHQERLSNLVERFPVLSNPVTRYLAADPADGAAEGRLKNAIEGVGLGLLTDGFVKAVKLAREALLARTSLEGAGNTAHVAPPELPPDAFAALGKEADSTLVAPDASPGARFGEQLKDFDTARTQYEALPETKGGRVINTALARELSPDYSASLDSRSALSADVHEPASAFVKKLYAEKLAEPAPEQDPIVLFTAGGTGAGKSTAIDSIPEVKAVADRAEIVYDTNLNDLRSSKTKINQALDAGRDVHIAYVYRDPVEAMQNGTLPRAETKGRTVPVASHLETHTGSFDTVKALQEAYADNPHVTFDVIDNTAGKGKAALSDMATIEGKRYTASQEELANVVEEAHQAGRISDRVRNGTLADTADTGAGSVTQGLPQENRPVAGQQLEPAGTRKLAPGDVGAADVPRGTFINFARIDAPDDVKRVMQQLSDLGSKAPDSAAAGTRSFADVKLDAAHQDAWQALTSRRAGQPLSDAQSLAARQLWVATTDKVAEVAETAAANPSEANLFAFRKMLDVHDMVQREVLGARASTARALASWRIPAGGGAERLQAAAAALEASGGPDVARALAARVAALGKAGMVKEMGAVIEKGAAARTRDAVLEAWINGLLSNPATHAANGISNLTVLPMRMAERAIGAKIGQALGDESGVAAGEAAAQWSGAAQGFRDMFQYYGKVLRSGLPQDSMLPPESAGPSPLSTMDLPQLTKLEHPPSITSDAFRLGSETALGRGVDLLGSTIRKPGEALNASDEFFKVIGYRMELNAQAVRQATAEVNAGTIAEDAFKSRVADIVANPPKNVRLAAADAALYQTFNNAPGALGKALGKLTATYPALKVILPFTRTPSNILNFSFERTPLAPLLSKFRADVAAGGARRDLALAQMALGSTAMLTAADLTMSGNISGRGPADKGVKESMAREGWQPYSVKLGDRWFSYGRLDPSGSLLGMAADATEMLMQAQHDAVDDGDTEKLAVATALAFAGNITNKTYLSGLSSIIEALNDPQRAAEGWAQRLAGSVVPAGAAGIERAQDPTVREVNSMMDAIRARTPGLSDSLPPKLDLWGQPVKTESGLGKPFDFFSPVYSKEPSSQPIDAEIQRLGANITMPGRRTSFDGVPIDLSQYPKAYSRYVELAGNALKTDKYGAPVTVGGMGARDYLNAIVTGKSPIAVVYKMRSDGPDGGKDLFIRDAISKYREKARAVLLDEFPKLKADVEEKKRQQRALKMPVLNAAN